MVTPIEAYLTLGLQRVISCIQGFDLRLKCLKENVESNESAGKEFAGNRYLYVLPDS